MDWGVDCQLLKMKGFVGWDGCCRCCGDRLVSGVFRVGEIRLCESHYKQFKRHFSPKRKRRLGRTLGWDTIGGGRI